MSLNQCNLKGLKQQLEQCLRKRGVKGDLLGPMLGANSFPKLERKALDHLNKELVKVEHSPLHQVADMGEFSRHLHYIWQKLHFEESLTPFVTVVKEQMAVVRAEKTARKFLLKLHEGDMFSFANTDGGASEVSA
jgi:hypothetical protein